MISSGGHPRAPGRSSTLRLLAFALVVAAVPASFLIRRVVSGAPDVDPLRSGPAPAFTLSSLEGTTVVLDGLPGEPVVVHFWGSWCEPCRLGLPRLAETRRRRPGLRVLGVVFRDEPEDARRAARAAGADWPMLLDPGEEVARAYGVQGVPVTFFLRPNGTIAATVVGPVSPPILDRQLSRILTPPR